MLTYKVHRKARRGNPGNHGQRGVRPLSGKSIDASGTGCSLTSCPLLSLWRAWPSRVSCGATPRVALS